METHPGERTITGTVQLRRIGGVGFPVEELVIGETTIAQLGRDSSLNIFFGRGRRILLTDGAQGRIKSVTSGRHIVPVIKSSAGTVAFSGPLPAKRSYGITGRDYGYALLPLGRIGLWRPGLWVLREHETDIAFFDDRHRTITTSRPIPVAAVLLVFTLVQHGIPGEADLLPCAS